MRTWQLRVTLLFFVGSFVLQLVWILAVPPFRGMDEFDHAYKAAAVADGHWEPSAPALPIARPRGDLVRVPRDLVAAARPICDSYDYISAAECAPSAPYRDGTVLVTSGAARYNPLFYWPIGQLSAQWHGADRLYVMRLLCALLCSALIALASWALTQWSRTTWPFLALLVALTPIAFYSGSTPAPNGPEMFAALSLWCCLVGLRRTAGKEERLLLAALPGVVVLATVRVLGPLWLALILSVCFALLGPGPLIELARANRYAWVALCGAILSSVTGALAWTRFAGGADLSGGYDLRLEHPWSSSIRLLPHWLLQSIGAFPDKVDAAPAVVYGCGALLIVGLLTVGASVATPRMRLLLAALTLACCAVPLLLTVTTYSQLGPIWQGRYGLPLAFGVPILAAAALDTRRVRVPGLAAVAVCVLFALEQSSGPVHVVSVEAVTSPLRDSAAWLSHSTTVIVMLSVIGVLLLALGVWTTSDQCRRQVLLARPMPLVDVPTTTPDRGVA